VQATTKCQECTLDPLIYSQSFSKSICILGTTVLIWSAYTS